jgi:hypothetical protein
LEFKEICLVGGFVGHERMGDGFWVKLEKIVVGVVPEKKNLQYVLCIL